jgi:hypothetical protein
MKVNKLQNENLKVISIHRQILENATPICCDNCGKTLINFAKVTNEKDVFRIGLDCKKKLIDKQIFADLKSENHVKQYEAKQKRAELNKIDKFLLLATKENHVLNVSEYGVNILDKNKHGYFGEGESVFFEDANFIKRNHLEDFCKKLLQTT